MKKDWNDIVSRFKNRTLPKNEWTHEAHLAIATWFLMAHDDFWSALCNFKSALILYNASVGINNTDKGGYHETITVFWLKQLARGIPKKDDPVWAEWWDQGVEACFIIQMTDLPSSFTDPLYIYQFYEREQLKSVHARAAYLEPTKSGQLSLSYPQENESDDCPPSDTDDCDE